jgi:hypothetical protein
MKFLIHLPPQKPFAPVKVRKPPFEFVRSPEHGNLHILDGREMTAEEVNQIADKVFRPKWNWDHSMKPSIRVLIDAEAETAETETTASQVTDEERDNWILAKAEEILQRRTAPPPPVVTEETDLPLETETQLETQEAERQTLAPEAEAVTVSETETETEDPPQPKNKGGRPRKPKTE